MSSTIIDSPDAESIASAAPDIEAHPHLPIHRAWLVAVALVAVVTLGLTVAWQTATGAAAPGTPGATSPATPAAPRVPAESVGAGLLALAWDLTPPSQRHAACAQFTANPGAAWTSYSTAAQDVATHAEFAAFFSARC
jgi:hypothetical protein